MLDIKPPAFMDAAVNLPPGGANAIAAANSELPSYARGRFRKDVEDLLRTQSNPALDDIQQAVGMALDLARRRGALVSRRGEQAAT